MKKNFFILGAVVLLALGTLGARFFFGGAEDGWICTDQGWQKHGQPSSPVPETVCGVKTTDEVQEKSEERKPIDPQPMPGGDRDEHGCIGSAGYTWCPSTGKCQRMWEEYCEEYKDRFRGNNSDQKKDNDASQQNKDDLIKVTSPTPGATIKSALKITGSARGSWYFEGVFPVMLTDWDGKIIAQGQAKAQGEWTTNDFVPFSAELTFEKPKLYDRGTLILKKDNPSGLPQNDDALEIPIKYE